MQRVIIICIIQRIYFTSPVESLIGQKVINANDGEFPFIASLQYRPEGEHFCLGALITTRHVLTAAHCLENEHPNEVQITFDAPNSQGTNNNSYNDNSHRRVRYTVASWLTYDDWAENLQIVKEPVSHDIAVITLTNVVNRPNVRPAGLNKLHKRQLEGKTATLLGWTEAATRKLIQKATVNILSDENCESRIHLVTNDLQESHSRTLCTGAEPYVLSECGDSGGPLVDGHNNILGVTFGECPDPKYAWGNFSEEFLQQYMVNLHFSVDYYRSFIVSASA